MNRLALALIVGCAACDGAETGNGLGPTLAVQITQSGSGLSPAATFAAQDANGTAIAVTSAQVNIGRIDFDKPGSATCPTATGGLSVHCDGAKVRIDGPILVDLITGTSTPSLEGVVIPPGTYKKIEVRLDDAKGSGAIAGHTFIASGTIDYQNMPTPYDLRLNFNEDAKFENVGGIVVGTDEHEQILALLDVTSWFSAIPLTECLDDGELTITGGRITIEDKGIKCSEVEKSLKAAIKASSKLSKGTK